MTKAKSPRVAKPVAAPAVEVAIAEAVAEMKPVLAEAVASVPAKLVAAPANAVPHPKLVFTYPKATQAPASVTLGTKPYKVKAEHNIAMWQRVVRAIAEGEGKATWTALAEAGVPAHFVGYCVRRGNLANAPQA